MPKIKFASPILGNRLRKIRKLRGVSSTHRLAEMMGGKYSFSSISRREAGDLRIDTEYLVDFCRALGLTEMEYKGLLASTQINMLRAGNQSNDRNTELIHTLAHIMVDAKHYQNYTVFILDQYLQTYDYARVIMENSCLLPDPERSARARTENTATTLFNKSKKIEIVCHENTLYYMVGNKDIMLAQLRHLLHFVDEPHAEFRVLPRVTPVTKHTLMNFDIIDDRFCVCDNRLDISITDDSTTLIKFQEDFEFLWSQSVIGLRRNEIIKRAMEYYEGLPNPAAVGYMATAYSKTNNGATLADAVTA